VQVLLWDNDGVLVDTEHLYFEATRDVLATAGIALTLDHYREMNLRQGRSCFDLARDAGASDDAIEGLKRVRNDAYHARVREGVELIDGVWDTLSALHGRYPMAIVTSSRPENLHAIHRHHGIDRFFDLVVASGDYARSKPHPDPYLEAARRLGVDPSVCTVIEDSERGLRAALAAGMHCFVIPNELTRTADFSGAHRMLSSIREVPGQLA
jgi:HAD superfamily hydrolase (TIGR01509 family)